MVLIQSLIDLSYWSQMNSKVNINIIIHFLEKFTSIGTDRDVISASIFISIAEKETNILSHI